MILMVVLLPPMMMVMMTTAMAVRSNLGSAASFDYLQMVWKQAQHH